MAGLEDSNLTTTLDESVAVIADGQTSSGLRAAVIQDQFGRNGLLTIGEVIVTSTFGFDPLPDAYFTINNTGSAGSTITIYVAGTNNDPTSPDADYPSYTKVFTVLAGEVGDEFKLRDRIVSELNLDSTFKTTCDLKALKVTDRPMVHISATAFSLTGEFVERPNLNDFTVTTTGTASVTVPFNTLKSRSKPISITRDPDSPHNLGVFGISGSVSVTAKELEDLFVQEASNVTYGIDIRQNGSVTPVDFTIPASATSDLFIESMIFDAQGNGVKFGQFLAQNITPTNGLQIQIKSNNTLTTFPVIKRTEDFKNKWAALSGDGGNFRIDIQAGADEMLAILAFDNPFTLKIAGSFGAGNDDYIRIRVQDNLTSVGTRLNFRAKGFEKTP